MLTVTPVLDSHTHCDVLSVCVCSYFDFLLLSYVCFGFSLDLPYIAAAEDFLGLGKAWAY